MHVTFWPITEPSSHIITNVRNIGIYLLCLLPASSVYHWPSTMKKALSLNKDQKSKKSSPAQPSPAKKQKAVADKVEISDFSSSEDERPQTSGSTVSPKENLRLSNDTYNKLQDFLQQARKLQEPKASLERTTTRLEQDITYNRSFPLINVNRQPPPLPTSLTYEGDFHKNWQLTITKANRKLSKLVIAHHQSRILNLKKEIDEIRRKAWAYIESLSDQPDKAKASKLFPILLEAQTRRINRSSQRSSSSSSIAARKRKR